jgi:hypothetical protein
MMAMIGDKMNARPRAIKVENAWATGPIKPKKAITDTTDPIIIEPKPTGLKLYR